MTEACTIEKNIPLPSRGRKYPFKAMDVGDSAFIPHITAPKVGNAWQYLRPKKFTARTCDEDGVKGVRVWRVE